jgi:hypothetical protein
MEMLVEAQYRTNVLGTNGRQRERTVVDKTQDICGMESGTHQPIINTSTHSYLPNSLTQWWIATGRLETCCPRAVTNV